MICLQKNTLSMVFVVLQRLGKALIGGLVLGAMGDLILGGARHSNAQLLLACIEYWFALLKTSFAHTLHR